MSFTKAFLTGCIETTSWKLRKFKTGAEKTENHYQKVSKKKKMSWKNFEISTEDFSENFTCQDIHLALFSPVVNFTK